MSESVKSQVFFESLADVEGPDLDPGRLASATGRLVARLRLPVAAGERWGARVPLGSPGRPPLVQPGWAIAAFGGLGKKSVRSDSFLFDTLSITQEGLHTVPAHLACALAKGFGADASGYPFVVADDPDKGETQVFQPSSPGEFAPARLAAGAAAVSGLLMLNTVQPHPHLGFQGALAGLGLGLSDREGKLDMHRDIRPKVDTPLCAGCGSCLSVCLFEAIEIRTGRAFINHEKCVGCGECMTACHMAGISPAEEAGIPLFQQKVGAAGAAFVRGASWGRSGKLGFINYLLNLDSKPSKYSRRPIGPRHLGILASGDPGALDRATWDLLAKSALGGLAGWSGFHQEPGPLLEKALDLGLGNQEYLLVE